MNVTADIKDYGKRISLGKETEHRIIAALRSRGMTIADPTPSEDMNDKIDGWIIDKQERHSLQIKYRETGDDILFEVMKDLKQNIPGRDSVSKAEFYLVVDRQGFGRLYHAAPIKKMAQQLLPVARLLYDSGKREWHGIGWQLKITVDRAHGNTKLMAYFNPEKFAAVKQWENLI